MKAVTVIGGILLGFYGGVTLVIWGAVLDVGAALSALSGALLIGLSVSVARACWKAGGVRQ